MSNPTSDETRIAKLERLAALLRIWIKDPSHVTAQPWRQVLRELERVEGSE